MIKNKGFTITELMFAMTFLSVLLIILVGSVVQITRTYNKGITMKRVNQSGRALGEELTRAFQQSSPQDIKYDETVAPGRLCLGSHSFIWSINTPSQQIENSYTTADGGGPVNFAKVADSGGSLCQNSAEDVKKSDAKELISDGLVVRNPTEYKEIISSSIPNSSRALVSMTFTLSTPDDDGSLIDDAEGVCKGGSGDDFCALNKFNVTVYAKGN